MSAFAQQSRSPSKGGGNAAASSSRQTYGTFLSGAVVLSGTTAPRWSRWGRRGEITTTGRRLTISDTRNPEESHIRIVPGATGNWIGIRRQFAIRRSALACPDLIQLVRTARLGRPRRSASDRPASQRRRQSGLTVAGRGECVESPVLARAV